MISMIFHTLIITIMKQTIDPYFYRQDKMYGTTTVGSRGQIVIPAEARKELGIKPGDQLLVMGKFGKVLGLMKAEQLTELVSMFMDHIADPRAKQEIKKRTQQILEQVGRKDKI